MRYIAFQPCLAFTHVVIRLPSGLEYNTDLKPLHPIAITLQHNLLAQNKEENKVSFTIQTAPMRKCLENSTAVAKPKAIPALPKLC